MSVYVVCRDDSDYGFAIVGVFGSFEKAKAAFKKDFVEQCDCYGMMDEDFEDSDSQKPEFKDEDGYAHLEFSDGSVSFFLDKMEVK